MLSRSLLFAVLLAACAHAPARRSAAVVTEPVVAGPPPAAPSDTTRRIEFARDVRPILETRCQPCHFAGGRMYEALPFDREETVHLLGARLFTRIKAPEEQRVIGELLSPGR